MTGIDATVVNGFCLNLSPATIEGFLAVYGDRPRYPGDTPAERRQDVASAARRLRLLPSDRGGVLVVALRTDERQEMHIAGFLETYERNSDRVTNHHLVRLERAIPILVSRTDVVGGP